MTGTAIALNQPVAASGGARTFFFNGRLLSAEDLRREQALRENGQSQLARLLGCGVASGLEVSATPQSSALSIAGGLGVTPSGQVIEVDDLDLDLAGAAGSRRSGGFADCAAAMANLEGPSAGVYLLVLTPTWMASGRAATLLGEVGACNRNVEQPAVRARLLEVSVPPGASEATLRNLVAYSLLAPEDPATAISTRPAGGAAAASVRLVGWWPAAVVPTLGVDDLPLAVLRIDDRARLVWLDGPAARRRLAQPPGLAGDDFWRESHALEMEAFAGQFVAQLADERASLERNDRAPGAAAFVRLPPVVLLDRAELRLLAGLFAQAFRLPDPVSASRADFVRALHDGLHDATGTTSEAGRLHVAILRLAGSDRYLLRLHAPTGTTLVDRGPGELSSKRLASLAGRTLHDRNADAEKRSLAASVLTQAPDRPRRSRKPPAG